VTADVHILAGAYALDALPPDEQRFFERHLEECEACRAEVAELRETAAALGSAAWEPPPAALKAQLMAQVDVTRQLPPVPAPRDERTMRERYAPMLAAAAAVLAIAVLGLGALTAHLNNRVQNLETQIAELGDDAEILPVLTAHDVQIAVLELAEGAGSARFVYSAALDRGLLVADGLAPLGPDEVYEIWTFHDGTPVPAGLFDADDDGRVMAHVDGSVNGAEFVAVTIEPRGGMPEPEGPVILQSDPL
jgi:anti-sigma-K factor RskA